MDDLVTAAEASRVDPPTRACDLGCGIGSVLMMVAWSFERARLVGVEAQSVSAALCRRSLALNGLADRVELREGDLRDPEALPEGPFDLVTGTPPYFRPEQGVVSDRPQRGPCRFELRGGVEAYFAAAARLVAPRGRFVVCEDARQRDRVETAAAEAGFGIHRCLEVTPKDGKAPLFSVFTCGRDVPMHPEDAHLVVRDARDRFTPEFRQLRERMGLPSF